MNRCSRQKNADSCHRDKHGDEQDRYHPARKIIDPIHHGTASAGLEEKFLTDILTKLGAC
jgi:hypothetical protein